MCSGLSASADWLPPADRLLCVLDRGYQCELGWTCVTFVTQEGATEVKLVPFCYSTDTLSYGIHFGQSIFPFWPKIMDYSKAFSSNSFQAPL